MIWTRSGDFLQATLANGIRLHFAFAARFKTTLVAGYQRVPLDAAATLTALVPSVLRRGFRACPTELQFRRRLERMYGAAFDVSVHRFGANQVVEWQWEIPCERFLGASRVRRPRAPGGLLAQAFHLFGGLLTDPVLEGDGFRPEVVAQEKEKLATLIRSQADNKDRDAYEKCRRLMARGGAEGLSPYGRLEDLGAVTPESLYLHYRRWLSRSAFDLYVMGPVRAQEVLDAARASMTFARLGAAPEPPPRRARPPAARGPLRLRGRSPTRQGKICLGYAAAIDPVGPEAEALLVYSGVLGGYAHSKLFQNVREKAALAYSVGSAVDRSTSWIFVQAGVEPCNRDRATRLIRKEIEAMRRGVSPKEFDRTLAAIRQALRTLADLRTGRIEAHYEEQMLGRAFSRSRALARFARVRPGALERVARKVKWRAACYLGPDRA